MTEINLAPPKAKTVPFTFQHLGRTFSDPYTWLQDKSDPEVVAYLEAENAYTKAALAHTEALQEQLYQEMKGRIKEDDSTVPARHGEYFYYSRTETGKQYKVFCRKHQSLDAPEELLIDENALAEGLEYCRVAIFEPSPDNSLLAYGVDTTGAWVFNLYIMDMANKQVLAGPIPNAAYSTAWASDNLTLFYTLFDAAHRPYKLMRHTARTDISLDTEIFHEEDDSFNIYVQRTRSGAYITLTARSHSTSEVRYLPAYQPEGEFKIVHPRQHWLEYYIEHHGERFLIRCNEEAENFKLMEAPTSTPGKENWREVLPHRADTLLEDVDAFKDTLVLWERQGGLQRIRLSAPDGVSDVHYVDFPEPAYALGGAENREYAAHEYRFTYTSLVTPPSTVDYGMRDHAWVVKKQLEIPSGYDAAQFTSERLFATAPDEVQVPISLFYKKGTPKDGSAPLLLYGYGSYGYSTDPGFDQKRLSLVERGFVFAIAHIRGGSELGRAWYENGRLMHKKNSFTDFIACGEHLSALGYSSPGRMAMMGGSAGGLLVSAVANLRPDLFKTVVALVPFTNVITAMLDRDLPLTVIEWEQWGHPDNAEAFDYMLSYSPYENVAAKAYPHILAKTGINDLQVPYWDPAKWVARLRELKTDDNRLLLVTNMGAGHGGSSGRFDYLREWAQYYAFLLDTLG
jgi:oligopeptidase B